MRKTKWAAAILAVAVLSGCGKLNMAADEWAKNNAIESANEQTINSAATIVIDKKFNMMRDVYNIEVDGEHVATVTGKVIKDFGNEFVLKTEDGKIIGTEYQVKRTFRLSLDRAAEFRGPDGVATGYVGERIISDLGTWGLKFHFMDLDGEEKGYSQQTTLLKIDRGASYYDMEDNEEYTIKQDNKIVLPSTYTVEVNEADDDLSITRTEAILLACIEDAILTSKK